MVWDSKTGTIIGYLKGHFDSINSLDFSSDGTMIVTVSFDKSIIIWDAKKRKEINRFSDVDSCAIICVKFSPDGKRIVTGGVDKLALIWDVETGVLLG